MMMTKEKTDPFQWLMTLLGAAWLAFFPLWQDGSYTRITRAKYMGMLWLLGTTAVVVVIIVAALLCRREGRRLRFHPVQALALAYLGWVILSAFFGRMADSVNGSGQLTVWMGARRYEGALTQGCYVGLFLLMSLYPPRLRAVMNVAALGMLISAGIVFAQYAGHNPFGLYPEGRNVRVVYEFQGTIGNIDMISGYLCLMTPALLYSFAVDRTGLICLLGGGAGVLLMLLIEVQSGLIALLAALAALALMMLRHPKTRARGCLTLACALGMLSLRLLIGLPWLDGTEEIVFPYAPTVWKFVPLAVAAGLALASVPLSRRAGRAMPLGWIAALIAVCAAVVAMGLWRAPFPEGTALWELREILAGRPRDSFGSERLGIWRMTLEMARKAPLFGTGPDAFWYAMPEYMAETGQQLVQNFDNPHNMLLMVLSGSGIPALLLYLALMAAVAVACLRASGRDRWLPALLAGLAAYQLQGLFTFSVCLVTPMFWAMLGMAVSLIDRREVSNHDEQIRSAAENAQGYQA